MIRWMRPGFEVVYEDVSRLSLEEDVPIKARSFEHDDCFSLSVHSP